MFSFHHHGSSVILDSMDDACRFLDKRRQLTFHLKQRDDNVSGKFQGSQCLRLHSWVTGYARLHKLAIFASHLSGNSAAAISLTKTNLRYILLIIPPINPHFFFSWSTTLWRDSICNDYGKHANHERNGEIENYQLHWIVNGNDQRDKSPSWKYKPIDEGNSMYTVTLLKWQGIGIKWVSTVGVWNHD